MPPARLPEADPRAPPDGPQRLREGLAAALQRLSSGEGTLHLPPPAGLDRRGDGHFHLVPELFLQLAGSTQFRFPHGPLSLAAGDAALLPPRLLHAEQVAPGAAGEPFANLVLLADGTRLTCHLAHEAAPGRAGILHLEAPASAPSARVLDWLAAAAALAPALARTPQAPGLRLQARGLVSAAAAAVLQALHPPAAGHPAAARAEPMLVARVRVLVQNQLGDAQLSVRGLARQSGCTPDHLSQVFSQATGEHLAACINRMRLQRAARLLQETGMAAKQVAWACGFASPSYFSRCFRLQHGTTPRAWRARHRPEAD